MSEASIVPIAWVIQKGPTATHRRRDSTAELSRVGGEY